MTERERLPNRRGAETISFECDGLRVLEAREELLR
jgi:hypothetical protein